jgi:hypothetical protein
MHESATPMARTRRHLGLGALSLAAVLVAAACGSAPPSVVIVTPSPVPATATPTVSATPSPTVAPTATPKASPTATASPTPAATATPTAAASASAPSVAAACSGKATNQPWWADTANHEPFGVYCGVLTGGWGFDKAGATWGTNGTVVAVYKTSSSVVVLLEGAFCAPAKPCPSHGVSLATAKVGDLPGNIYSLTAPYAVNVPGATPAPYMTIATGQVVIAVSGSYGYAVVGQGVTQAGLISIAAAVVKVAKS